MMSSPASHQEFDSSSDEEDPNELQAPEDEVAAAEGVPIDQPARRSTRGRHHPDEEPVLPVAPALDQPAEETPGDHDHLEEDDQTITVAPQPLWQ